MDLVAELASRGSLGRLQLTPLLVGVATDAYAQGIKARLRQVAPSSVILESFMNAEQLAAQVGPPCCTLAAAIGFYIKKTVELEKIPAGRIRSLFLWALFLFLRFLALLSWPPFA